MTKNHCIMHETPLWDGTDQICSTIMLTTKLDGNKNAGILNQPNRTQAIMLGSSIWPHKQPSSVISRSISQSTLSKSNLFSFNVICKCNLLNNSKPQC